MNRIDAKFLELAKRKKTAFIAYITVGDPNLETTVALVSTLADAGADIIELGIPFSDPLADGTTIQAASQRALAGGVTLTKIFPMVSTIRKQTQIPLLFMTYYNPVFHYGERRFVDQSKKVGIDGLIIPDLPPQEATALVALTKKEQLAMPFFLSPTTTRERMKDIIKDSTGFIYYVSLTGVTGARRELPTTLRDAVLQIKRMTNKPVCVGFGVSTPEQVLSLSKIADGVIVGSAIVKAIEKNLAQKDLAKRVGRFVKTLTKVL